MRTIIQDHHGQVSAEVKRRIREVLRRAAVELKVGAGDVVVEFVDREKMAELNRRHLARRGPTDVLSFPADIVDPAGRRHIGDIAICLEVIAAQASDHGHAVEREFEIMTLHGLLHLLGHDHESDDGEMETLEAELRRRLLDSSGG